MNLRTKLLTYPGFKTAFLEDLAENDLEEDIYEGNDDEEDGEDNWLTLKALGFMLPVSTGGVFSTPLCKIRSRHPSESKLSELIAYIMFYKIC